MLGMLIVSTLSPFGSRGFHWQRLCQPSLLPEAWNASVRFICGLLHPFPGLWRPLRGIQEEGGRGRDSYRLSLVSV